MRKSLGSNCVPPQETKKNKITLSLLIILLWLLEFANTFHFPLILIITSIATQNFDFSFPLKCWVYAAYPWLIDSVWLLVSTSPSYHKIESSKYSWAIHLNIFSISTLLSSYIMILSLLVAMLFKQTFIACPKQRVVHIEACMQTPPFLHLHFPSDYSCIIQPWEYKL